MKNIYKTTLITLLTLGSAVVFGQSDADNGTTLSPEEQEARLEQVQNAEASMFDQARGANCDTAQSPIDGGNSFHGVMFDVDATVDVWVQTFWVTVQSGSPVNIAVFAKTGTHVGSETNSADWTFLDSAIVTGAGSTAPVKVPLALNYAIGAGTVHAFYVTTTNGETFHYTTGNTLGSVLTSNAQITVYEGSGGEYPFNVTYSPRDLNGAVDYCVQSTAGVSENSLASKVSIYPQPAKDQAIVTLPASSESTVEVVNMTGQRVIDPTNVQKSQTTLNVSGLSKGIYFVKVQSDGEQITRKLIKQ